MTSLSRRVGILLPILLLVAAGFVATPGTVHAAQGKNAPLSLDDQPPLHEPNPLHDAQVALIRLPLAALLGAALALRPRRRGTPPRTPAVLQTQIILSIVGAVIMLVVGASLARAFGIVGAANL